MKKLSAIIVLFLNLNLFAQQDLLSLVDSDDKKRKEFVTNAFKSTRVIKSQSMELLAKGVMDVRILHRFGTVNSGAKNLFGLDQASMRIGFDYGISNNFSIGVGRSNVGKELDGFLKFRVIRQSTGPGSFPVSLVFVTGVTLSTMPVNKADSAINFFSNRLAYFHELIIGRKFGEKFSLQITPVFVHRNMVAGKDESNDVIAVGVGARLKFSKRIAFVVDYHYVAYGLDKTKFQDPLSVGLDIETGGHVFQLHFSNATGMNEKAFICNTTDQWGKAEVRFGFNLSRVFTIGGR